jgi:hypothetical protein
MNFFAYIQSINPFSIEELNKQKNISQKLFYCRTHLKELAKGSSRNVFDFGESVIKIARNQKGIEQNKVEMEIGKIRPDCVPNLILFSDDCSWNIFEKVEQVTKEEFENLTNTTLTILHELLKYKKDRKRKNIDIDYKKENQIQNNKLMNELSQLIEQYDLSVGDMVRISSWGKKNGKVLLIDFGLTSEIYQKFYKK